MKIYKHDINSCDRGDLMAIELKNIPIDVKRTFIVYRVPEGCKRGGHAHIKTNQYLVCLHGSIDVIIDDSKTVKSFKLKKGDAILVDKMLWDSQIFYGNAILLVFCDTNYDEKDYIRDYERYKKHTLLTKTTKV